MSRNHARRQIDYNRPLILMEDVDEFFQQENPDYADANGTTSVEKKRPGQDNRVEIPGPKKKENISIPVARKIEDPLQSADEKIIKRRKNQTQYIRMSYCVLVPNPEEYEMSDKDMEFLKELNEKFSKKGAPNLTTDIFENIITHWEHETNKDDPIPLSKALIQGETKYPSAPKEYFSEIYTYWIKLREKYKRPMLRKFLKVVNKDDTNPNAAFRIRENPKMRTRRAQKANDADGLQKMRDLKKDMDMGGALMQNIKYREMLKLEHMELSILRFENTVKERTESAANLTPLVQKFKENYENEKYIALKNKLKEYGKIAQKIIQEYKDSQKAEAIVEQPSYVKPITRVDRVNTFKRERPVTMVAEENNFDLGCFIASLAEESCLKEITPQKIFNIDSLMSVGPQPAPETGEAHLEQPYKPIPRQPSTTVAPTTSTIPGEERNIFKYKLRKRYDRFGRVVLEKIFEEDENDYTTHNKEYYETQFEQRIPILTSEVVEKLHNGKGGTKDPNHEYENLHELYADRFKKYSDIYPFVDSDDDQDLAEFTKQIKRNISNNFKTFMRQRRVIYPNPSAPVLG